MECQKDPLVSQIKDLYEKVSSLESLQPSKNVNMLFTQLVLTCTPPSPIDVTKLCNQIQIIRSNLIRLCGEPNEIRSGPLPLTSIVLALNYLPNTRFNNYDLDLAANKMAARLVEPNLNLSSRMKFHTKDVMSVGKVELGEYDVVFLAALVGMNKEEKVKVIHYLAKNMAPASTLMVQSAHGARAFLYPVPDDLCGFEVFFVYHPTDEVINSAVIARRTVDVSSPGY